MRALDSSRWETLRASGGGSGTVARRVLTEIHAGTGSDWPELYHQACHQLTVGEVTYAVVPHAIHLAGRLPCLSGFGPWGSPEPWPRAGRPSQARPRRSRMISGRTTKGPHIPPC